MNNAMSHNTLTVAAAQLAGTRDVDANIRKVAQMTADAAASGAELIVFPEAVMYDLTAETEMIAKTAAERGAAFESELAQIAAKHRMAVVAGSYAEGTSDRARNIMLALGADGQRIGEYQKLHLYDAFRFKESDKSERARLQPDFGELCVFDRGGFRFGLVNCYDLRFPEMMRALVDRGVNVLLLAAAWIAGPLKEYHWDTLAKARAIENTSYVVAACQPPPTSVGLSTVIDPNGMPISAVADGDGLAIAELCVDRLTRVRDILPSLAHRRYRVMAGE